MDYNKKITTWSHRTDVQLYRKPIQTGLPSPNRGKTRTPYDEMDLKDQIASDIRRKAYFEKRIRYLADAAMENNLTTFVTLTFKEPVDVYEVAQHQWDLFLKRLKYRLNKPLLYIAVHEIQKKRSRGRKHGIFHFHALMDLDFLPQAELQEIWGLGIVHIRKLSGKNTESEIRQIMYAFKYIVKDVFEDSKLGTRTRYRKIYVSRGLKKPHIEKSLSMDTAEDVIFDNLEEVLNATEYAVKNYRGEIINHVESIQLKNTNNKK